MYPQASNRAALLLAAAVIWAGAAGEARAQRGAPIPADTVVRVSLDERLSSQTARIGDRVTATVAPGDYSGFPEGTRLEGTVTDVQRATADRPGVLDMQFRGAILPDGRRVALNGELASLAEDDVRRTEDGRLESRREGGGRRFDWKWVGYGAAGGAVLGEILGDNLLKGALLGGLGGAIYGYLNRDRDRGRFQEVTLARGTEFGVRLNDRIAFDDRGTYRYRTRNPRDFERVAGARDEYRFGGTEVRYNGRPLVFRDVRPVNLNGTLYVPLAPIAEATGTPLRYRAGDDAFVIDARSGRATGYLRDGRIAMGNRDQIELEAAPVSIDGEIYVPAEYLTRVMGMDASWDRRAMRLELNDGGGAPGRVLDEPIRGRVQPNRLFNDLVAIDYQAFRTRAGDYRVVDADEFLTQEQVRLLEARIDENSVARRNRDLLTAFLRDARQITARERVVGVSADQRAVYVR
jgi:hypothetical protein